MSETNHSTVSSYAAYKQTLEKAKPSLRKASLQTTASHKASEVSEKTDRELPSRSNKAVGRIIKTTSAVSNQNKADPTPPDSRAQIKKYHDQIVSKVIANNQNKPNPTAPDAKVQTKKYHDQIMSKVKLSQMSGFGKKPLISISNDLGVFERTSTKAGSFVRKVDSLAGHYENKLGVVISSFQARKEQIDQEIRSLRVKKIDCGERSRKVQPADSKEETPKFAQSRGRSYRSVGEGTIKASRKCVKWADFIKNIKQQIGLEQKLRNVKHDVKEQSKPKVKQILFEKYKISDIAIVTLQSEQFDPFYTPSSIAAQELAKRLAETYNACEQFWRKNMRHRYESEVLGAIYTALQGEKERGAVSLKGFVRELGIIMQNEKYLRNRDLFRVYKRIWPFSREKFVGELGLRPILG